ncbi:B12-binding domain-containing protein [Candidatus Izemoplasma sp. B36]|uniref:cobalamin B12-binding domain-containing protein n=1 Tax=Candidatus Izemoplasma sp. B36 TaxID=3242468 RepID=UPI00355765D2
MNNKYKEFLKIIESEDKDKALLFILNLFEKGENIKDVYENYLIPVMADWKCDLVNQEICIWREHTRTSIIRTIVEASYKYLIAQKDKSINKLILSFCPQEEYHEIGAIIATNFFTLVGFNAKYIGANTPSDDIISAIKVMNPDYIALSVTNYYNLVVVKKLTKRIREMYPDLKIIVGGQVFKNRDSLSQIEYDYCLSSYQDILKFRDEVIS